jgi:hypothetical protein
MYKHNVLSVTLYYTVHDFALSCFLGGWGYHMYQIFIYKYIVILEVGIRYNYCMH